MKVFKFKQTLKLFVTLILISMPVWSFSQGTTVTFRIEESSANPNCGGYYCVKSNGNCVTPVFQYSYPGNINNLRPFNPSMKNNCFSTNNIPNEVQFINVSDCSNTSFLVPLTGVAVVKTVNVFKMVILQIIIFLPQFKLIL